MSRILIFCVLLIVLISLVSCSLEEIKKPDFESPGINIPRRTNMYRIPRYNVRKQHPTQDRDHLAANGQRVPNSSSSVVIPPPPPSAEADVDEAEFDSAEELHTPEPKFEPEVHHRNNHHNAVKHSKLHKIQVAVEVH